MVSSGNILRTIFMRPNEGVSPSSDRAEQSSIRLAPPVTAFITLCKLPVQTKDLSFLIILIRKRLVRKEINDVFRLYWYCERYGFCILL